MNPSPDSPLWRAIDDAASQLRPAGEAGIGAIRLTRRDFLALSAAAAALATAGCQGPVEEIVPHVDPRRAPPGVPQFFATAMSLGGLATGLLVECNQGRPTKIEGNPSHPASLGATGVFEQATVLDFWDPTRSRALTNAGQPASRDAFMASLRDAVGAQGEGLRILMRYDSSATLAAQLQAVRRRYPGCRVHTWEPLHRDQSLAGARLAFGRAAEPVYDLAAADVVVAFDRDFVGDGPGHLRYARDLMARRAAGNRLYAVESSPSLTGAVADHRLVRAPHEVAALLAELAAALRGDAGHASGPMAAIARDLQAHRGSALILAGESLPPEAHALVHQLNDGLGARDGPVRYIAPVCGDVDCSGSIRELVNDMRAGKVSALIILGGNPVHDAPVDIGFADALRRVQWSVHAAPRDDETSAASLWHVPSGHFFEHWSDARAFDGTASVIQPVVAARHGGWSHHELLALLLAPAEGTPRDVVRERWVGKSDADADERWQAILRDGVVPGSAFESLDVRPREIAFEPARGTPGWALVLGADASLRDGEFAGNAWLQELPRPHSKLTWDNAACVSPTSAAELGVATGDLVEIAADRRRLVAPVWVLPGQADRTIGLALGYGRSHAGPVGSGVGVNAYPLRDASHPWLVPEIEVRKIAGHHDFATTQNHAEMEGREPVRRITLAALAQGAKVADDKAPLPSLYPEWAYDSYRWAMVVDLTSCIGCNACTIACQAENNIPTVGKEEVARGREMHWIRVDRYYEGTATAPRTHFQPVPCMHCENAPCEPVCPVGATVHDSEGLNVQVYNRCVGTRFCSNNCPYKVRRFNFLHYAARQGEPPLEGRNPEVTVRMRGVMEKCNYCLQRITRARIAADREGRRIADGEVVTACQAACPTRAITFGDLSDAGSAVSRAKRSPLDYALLHELNTRPRTTYHARVSNPNPDVEAS